MKTFIALIVLTLILYGGMALILGAVVMLLWNACLVGTIAGVSAIGFWKAVGITFLFALLFNMKVSSSSKSS